MTDRLTRLVPIELTNRKTDKIKHYKWSDAGTKGELLWIPKGDLHVDHKYQRVATERRTLKIAGDWWWMACGTISVARRSDGVLVVFDGQHRVLAAMRRSDVTDLPCIVFDSANVAEEARAFLDMNTGRKPLTAVAKFPAKIEKGDEVAIRLSRLISSSGRYGGMSTTSSASTIGCIAALESCAMRNFPALERVFPLIKDLCEGSAMHKQIVQALHYIECQHESDSFSISVDPWRSRFMAIGFDGLLRAAKNYSLARGKSTEVSWAIGMASAVNKGMRSRKLLPEKT